MPLEKILPHPMQTLRRNRCQTRTRPREKACVYGVRVSGATIFAYVWGNPLKWTDPLGLAVKCETIAQIPLIADIQKCTEDGTTPTEQDALDAKRMTDRELDKACKANGYEDAHAFKKDLGLDSKSDIFVDKNGNLYSGPRKGSGIPQYLHMNNRGIVPKL